jgi:hypothetical protein
MSIKRERCHFLYMKIVFPAHFWKLVKVIKPCTGLTLLILIAALLLTGCGREEVKVYRVAKEQKQPSSPAPASRDQQLPPGHPEVASSPSLPPGHPEIARNSSPSPPFTWSLPANWEELPASGMRAASFSAKGKGGKVADVSLVPLSGRAGGVLGNVNRWRGQVGQPNTTEEELTKSTQPIEISGQQAQFFEITGKSEDPESRTNILGAILSRNGTTWFFKMTGNDAVVTEQKPAFLEFLNSFKFQSPISQDAQASSQPQPDNKQQVRSTSSGQTPKWQVPQGWREAPPSQFLIAKFLITGENKAQASVNVSQTGGSLTDNINRWRDQLGLERLSTEQIEKQVQTLAVPGGKAMLIDMHGTDPKTGQKARTIGAVLPRTDGTWYYKLMGDEQLVEREKEALLEFVKTATYP